MARADTHDTTNLIGLARQGGDRVQSSVASGVVPMTGRPRPLFRLSFIDFAMNKTGSEPYELIFTTILPTARRELMASKASRNRSNGNPIVGGGSTAPVWSHKAISFLKRS